MAKFVFKLDGVLRQREHIEQQRQRELAVIQSEMAVFEAQLRALDSSMRGAEQDLRTNRLVGRLDLAFLAAYRRYAIDMQRRAVAIAQKMARVQAKLEAARQNLIEAAKQKKVIEKLRERELQRWREDLAKRETAAMDEIAMQMASRTLREQMLDSSLNSTTDSLGIEPA